MCAWGSGDVCASGSAAWQVWDDKSLLNVDFSLICSNYSLKDINDLEKGFLEMIKYNVSISASLYASYYFELRTLCEKAGRRPPPPPPLLPSLPVAPSPLHLRIFPASLPMPPCPLHLRILPPSAPPPPLFPALSPALPRPP